MILLYDLIQIALMFIFLFIPEIFFLFIERIVLFMYLFIYLFIYWKSQIFCIWVTKTPPFLFFIKTNSIISVQLTKQMFFQPLLNIWNYFKFYFWRKTQYISFLQIYHVLIVFVWCKNKSLFTSIYVNNVGNDWIHCLQQVE